MKQLSQFAFAGTVGYLADTFTLLLVYPWAGAYAGRFISFRCAVLTTWLINRSLTFRQQRDGKSVQGRAVKIPMPDAAVANQKR